MLVQYIDLWDYIATVGDFVAARRKTIVSVLATALLLNSFIFTCSGVYPLRNLVMQEFLKLYKLEWKHIWRRLLMLKYRRFVRRAEILTRQL